MKKQELLIKSREAMLAAVQIYNNPQIIFKSESFISLGIISWTYLLHAYYANRGIDYRYYQLKGKRKFYDRTKYGAYKYWELERCLNDQHCPIDQTTTNNLKFLIGIRHEIEHQMTNRIDETISAKLQACSINYNFYVKKLFGDEYGVDRQLGLSIQFSPITPEQKGVMLNNSKIAGNIQNFITEFEDNLTEDDARSPKYAYRLLFTPLNANRKGQADQVIEFIKTGTEGSEQLNQVYALIKETEKKKYRAKDIVDMMHKKGYLWFTTAKMTKFWKDELGSREGYGVYIAKDQWFWYENWIVKVEEYCEKIDSEVDNTIVKKGFYPSEVVDYMIECGFYKFTINDLTVLWRDTWKIDRNNTEYGYRMENGRYVWNESFLEMVKGYCTKNKKQFVEDREY